MEKRDFVLKGNICYSKSLHEFEVLEQGYLVCENGESGGVYETVPEAYAHLPIRDCGERLIVPGLTDLHVHAPQFAFRGLGMDMELLEWLNTNAFPEESKYVDLEYAKKAYGMFVEALKRSGTTRACIFATAHVPATVLLMDMLEDSGLKSMVGKVNMDRNAPDYLREADAKASYDNTIQWLKEIQGRYTRTAPILTPRFIPSCTDELMELLGQLQKESGIPLQSHLSENRGEIDWVRELCPQAEFYGDAYDRFGLFGKECKTIMAHCVHSDEKEQERMLGNGVYVAHCPDSNTNLASGVAPVRSFLEKGIHVGLGTDIAGGETECLFATMAEVVKVSKLRWRLQDERLKPLTFEEVFYLGTKGGGEFFGKVGSFEQGYEFDALVIDDSTLSHPQSLTARERMERFIYLGKPDCIQEKYVAGAKII